MESLSIQKMETKKEVSLSVDISKLSLDEKIGQMVMCGFSGHTRTNEIETLIEKYHIGGVIYFSRNIDTLKQVYELSNDLQRFNRDHSSIPLFVSIDQEGGMVARILDVTLMPGNMAIGATNRDEFAYEAAKISGQELRTLGVNVNFAPCVDVNNNPANPVIGVRSYGSHPQRVAALGEAQIKGYQQSNVVATAKHFPGHGDTSVDSHLDLPQVTHTMKRMHEVELVPFKRAVSAGVDAIMTAHVVFPALEEKLPSTLSYKIITGLLKEELQFNGVVFTDCMEMKAISDYFGTENAAVKAVKAGVDVVLVSHTYDVQVETIEKLKQAVLAGEITEERINQSVQRILSLKEKRTLHDGSTNNWEQAQSTLKKRKHVEFVKKVREESITLIKGSPKEVILDQNKPVTVVYTKAVTQSEADENINEFATLGTCLQEAGYTVNEIEIPPNLSEEEVDEAVKKSRDAEQLLVCTYNASMFSNQQKLVRQLHQSNPDLIVVGLRSPYDIQTFPEVSTFMTGYENRLGTLRAITDILRGAKTPKGKLPVTLS